MSHATPSAAAGAARPYACEPLEKRCLLSVSLSMIQPSGWAVRLMRRAWVWSWGSIALDVPCSKRAKPDPNAAVVVDKTTRQTRSGSLLRIAPKVNLLSGSICARKGD